MRDRHPAGTGPDSGERPGQGGKPTAFCRNANRRDGPWSIAPALFDIE
jgi:hypothetical protein